MSKKEVYICDICGKHAGSDYGWRRVKRFLFHHEITGGKDVCRECLEQLRAMREANMMADRKEE
ncbi:MAG: hypothetical protein IJV26_02620 [Lachnospiraceae bacterium]|nr:hypothetical protein [Lachnospiraceae bacterium]